MKELSHNKKHEIVENYHNGNKKDFFESIERMSKYQLLDFLNAYQSESDFILIILRYYINK